MSGKELDVFDARELIRRLQLGQSERSISREMGIARKTIKRYREMAQQEEWLDKERPPEAVIIQEKRDRDKGPQRAEQERSSVLPYKEQVEKLMADPRMTVTVILQRLQERGYLGSYSSVHRFVSGMRAERDPEGFCRMEVAPGTQAQVDFGYLGELDDPLSGRKRKAWFFVMTLSHSRHMYAEIVYDQSSWTWLRLHEAAFRHFDGVPEKIVLDNLKAAIIKAAVHDPLVQRSYRDLAGHYGFVVDPNRPRTPHHKGKVERSVRYIKQNFLPGRSFQDLRDANEQLWKWLDEVAAVRIHGTTGWKPVERYEQVEHAALRPLPEERWEPSVWKEAKLHPDCHIHVEKSFYSAPFRLIGRQLTVQVGARQVRIFNELELVATHERAMVPRERKTHEDHLPPHKVHLLMATPQGCLRQAEEIGPHALQWMQRLLTNQVTDRLRSGLAALRLAEKFSPQRMEVACQRALDFDDISYGTLKRILDKELDQQPWKHLLPPATAVWNGDLRYVRDPSHYFAGNREVH